MKLSFVAVRNDIFDNTAHDLFSLSRNLDFVVYFTEVFSNFATFFYFSSYA